MPWFNKGKIDPKPDEQKKLIFFPGCISIINRCNYNKLVEL
jgi:hypothetical protein